MRKYTGIFLFGFLAVVLGASALAQGVDNNAEELVLIENFSDSQLPESFANHLGMTFQLIPEGKFVMGSYEDEPNRDHQEVRHSVEITEPFYMAAYEVTVRDFSLFVKATGYKTEAETDGNGGWGFDPDQLRYVQSKRYNWRNPGFAQKDTHPVVNVSWNDAQAYIAWLNRMDGCADVLGPNAKYSLPSEAQWEYAARAGYDGSFPLGEDPEDLVKVANVANAAYQTNRIAANRLIKSNDGYEYTAPVGKFLPNAFGLYDMIGNVMEWCSDWYRLGYYQISPERDPAGPANGLEKVIRGGSWYSHHAYCRIAFRGMLKPNERFDYIGFRVAITNEAAQNDNSGK